MFELAVIVIFMYLMFKAIGLAFKLTWGVAKIMASIIMGLAFPLLILCVFFFGGIVILIPVIMIAIAAGILRCAL